MQRGFSVEQAQKIMGKNTEIFTHHIEATLRDLSITVVHRDDPEFPTLLRKIPNAPTILYVR